MSELMLEVDALEGKLQEASKQRESRLRKVSCIELHRVLSHLPGNGCRMLCIESSCLDSAVQRAVSSVSTRVQLGGQASMQQRPPQPPHMSLILLERRRRGLLGGHGWQASCARWTRTSSS